MLTSQILTPWIDRASVLTTYVYPQLSLSRSLSNSLTLALLPVIKNMLLDHNSKPTHTKNPEKPSQTLASLQNSSPEASWFSRMCY